jgi:N-terminal domain of anti-restriction factor ArdC
MATEQIKLDWNTLLDEALTAPGNLGNVYNRFHDYSLTNNLLFLMQGIREPVASFKTWKSLGRHVVAGSRAKEVIVPVLVNEPAEDEPLEEKRKQVARLIGFKVVRAVFALSDTDGEYLPPPEPQEWSKTRALGNLGIREVYFDQVNGNLQGWSRGLEFAINPMAVHPNKTTFHELGHIVLGHTLPHHYEEYTSHKGVMEFQAEATAYLLMNELELMDDETASHSRGYIRHWLGEEQPPDQAIRQVFTAADRILRAGRSAPIGAPTPTTAADI